MVVDSIRRVESGRGLCTLHAFCKPEVAQVSNLLCRRLPVGRACELRSVGGLEIRDTADWKSALRGCLRQDACKVQNDPALRFAWCHIGSLILVASLNFAC